MWNGHHEGRRTSVVDADVGNACELKMRTDRLARFIARRTMPTGAPEKNRGNEAAGATMTNVDKCTVFLTRQADFAPVNEVWRRFSPPIRLRAQRSLRQRWLGLISSLRLNALLTSDVLHTLRASTG